MDGTLFDLLLLLLLVTLEWIGVSDVL